MSITPKTNYSLKLRQYIGQVELTSFEQTDSFMRYRVFGEALETLAREGFDEQEARVASRYLSIRMRQTKPENIGCASGEAGEAD